MSMRDSTKTADFVKSKTVIFEQRLRKTAFRKTVFAEAYSPGEVPLFSYISVFTKLFK